MSSPKALPPPELDGHESAKQLDELRVLSGRLGFNLFEYLRALGEEGLSPFTCKVDEATAITAGHVVIRYQLCERLKGCLAAMRAWDSNQHRIKPRIRRNKAAGFRC
jgi:hypothetical protein